MPERPPKKWFYKAVETIEKERPEVDDPYALAGWMWHYGMTPEYKSEILKSETYDPAPLKQILKSELYDYYRVEPPMRRARLPNREIFGSRKIPRLSHWARRRDRHFDTAAREDGLVDPDKLPKPIDIHGYDGQVVRLVPDINHLIEAVVTLPKHQWQELLKTIDDEGYEDVEVDEKNGRIVRRGKQNSATNIFIDHD